MQEGKGEVEDMGWIKWKRGAAGSEQMEKQTWVTKPEREREGEREECLKHMSPCCSYFLCFSTCKEYQAHPPLLTHTHTHTQQQHSSRQTENGNSELCTAGRQHTEKWSSPGKYPGLLTLHILSDCWKKKTVRNHNKPRLELFPSKILMWEQTDWLGYCWLCCPLEGQRTNFFKKKSYIIANANIPIFGAGNLHTSDKIILRQWGNVLVVSFILNCIF